MSESKLHSEDDWPLAPPGSMSAATAARTAKGTTAVARRYIQVRFESLRAPTGPT